MFKIRNKKLIFLQANKDKTTNKNNNKRQFYKTKTGFNSNK